MFNFIEVENKMVDSNEELWRFSHDLSWFFFSLSKLFIYLTRIRATVSLPIVFITKDFLFVINWVTRFFPTSRGHINCQYLPNSLNFNCIAKQFLGNRFVHWCSLNISMVPEDGCVEFRLILCRLEIKSKIEWLRFYCKQFISQDTCP